MRWPEFSWLISGALSKQGSHLAAHFFPPKTDPSVPDTQPEEG